MIKTTRIQIATRGETDIRDITADVAAIIETAQLRDGQVTLFVPGSTAGLTTIEFEPGVVEDLRRAIQRAAPEDMEYMHDRRWGDGNGYSHVRAALIGPSLVVPVVDGRMTLGTWQQIVLLDFDNRPRDRHVVVQLHGTRAAD